MNKILFIILFSFSLGSNLRRLDNFNWDLYYAELVNTHNILRAKHGQYPLNKDKKLENLAKETANDSLIAGTLKYGEAYRNGEYYGQNLYLGSGNPHTGKYVAEYWYSENIYYNYGIGKSNNGATIGHFTQIIWKTTKKIGCAVSIGRWKIYKESYYICCYYYPGGNLPGLYTKNVVKPIR